MKFYYLISMVATIIILSGCISVDYVGQKFAPTPQDTKINIYKESVEYPLDRFKVIGRATITAPGDTSSVDMWDKVMDLVRNCGGDGVKVVSAKRELLRTNHIQPVSDGRRPSSAAGATGRTNSGELIEINSFGEETNGDSHAIVTYEMVLKVLVLKDIKSFNAAMEIREKREQDLLEKTE